MSTSNKSQSHASQNQASQNQNVAKRRILVVDDHPIVRQGLALLINRESDLVVCGEAEEAMGALHVLASARPDVLIVDISLNGPDGLDLLKTIRTTHPTLPVLILSMHDESIYAERALRAGANGYIMKQEATEKVLVAVRRILIGEVYVSDGIANKMLKHYITGSGTLRSSSIAELSDRELEVFRLIGEGHGTRQIAEELHISIKTVESYQAHIKEKLSLRSARELMQHAIQWNMNEKAV
ncbi:MAG: response regulator transcription factor [Candidatus Sulfotelmatobacter sp.]|jgi:DNA-binding NarL/FixJ family response regulator